MEFGKTIGILDYGMGNIASAKAGLMRAGAKNAVVVSTACEISKCDGLVIPGVGAFKAAMQSIRSLGMEDAIMEFAGSGRPLLGVCLGMQILFDTGTEGGKTAGLGLLSGRVELLRGAPKLPQIGWNTVRTRKSPLWKGIAQNPYFYFVHSYACFPKDGKIVIGTTRHGADFASAVMQGSITGVQFHPEKSGPVGQALLGNFVEFVEKWKN